MNKLLLLLLGVLMLMTLSLASREAERGSSSSGERSPFRLDPLSLSDVLRVLVREERRRSVLEEEGASVLRRIQDRQDIAARIIARQMTLPEAIACFRDLNTELRQDMLLAAFTGASEEERLGRQVILWVSNALLEQPDRQAAEVARLEIELKRSLHGGARSGVQ